MNNEKALVKILFGVLIFMFSLAFAYFTAYYLNKNGTLETPITLAFFGGIYILVGIITTFVFSISLGFLFASDILLIHVLFDNYTLLNGIFRTLILGCILLILYCFAFTKLKNPTTGLSANPTESNKK